MLIGGLFIDHIDYVTIEVSANQIIWPHLTLTIHGTLPLITHHTCWLVYEALFHYSDELSKELSISFS